MARPDYPWKLPPAITQRLGHDTYGAQRSIHEDDHLLLVLHEPPVKDSNEREHRVFLRLPAGKWLFQGAEHGQHMLADTLSAYEGQLNQAESRYDRAETADDLFPLLDRLLPLTRAAINMRDALQQARDQAKDDQSLITWRDRAVEVARGLELLLANARLALEYRLARQAEEQTQAALVTTRAQLKLNTIAAVTAPVLVLAALLGMNVPHGLESAPGWVFWAVFALGLAVGLYVKGWVRTQVPAPPAPGSKNKPTGKAQQAGKKPTKK